MWKSLLIKPLLSREHFLWVIIAGQDHLTGFTVFITFDPVETAKQTFPKNPFTMFPTKASWALNVFHSCSLFFFLPWSQSS